MATSSSASSPTSEMSMMWAWSGSLQRVEVLDEIDQTPLVVEDLDALRVAALGR